MGDGEVPDAVFPEVSGEFGFIHAELDGRAYMRFSKEPGKPGHPPIGEAFEKEMGLGWLTACKLPHAGGGLADVDIEGRQIAYRGSSGMFGDFDRGFMEPILGRHPEFSYSFKERLPKEPA